MDKTRTGKRLWLYGQTFAFAWCLCVCFSTVPLSLAEDPIASVLIDRITFLIAMVVALIVLIAIERKRPSLMTDDRCAVLGVLASCIGTFLIVFGASVRMDGAPLIIVGFFLAGMGNAALLIAFGKLYAKVPIGRTLKAVPFSQFIAAFIYWGIASVGSVVGIPLIIALPLLACGFLVMGYRSVHSVKEVNAGTNAGADGGNAGTNEGADEGNVGTDASAGPYGESASPVVVPMRNSSDVSFTKWKITLQLAVYWFAFGIMEALTYDYLLGNSGSRGVFVTSVAIMVAAISAGIFVIVFLFRWEVAKTFWVFVPIALAGVTLAAVVDSNLQTFAYALVLAASLAAQMQLIAHFGAICSKHGYPPTVLFGYAFGMLLVSEILGIFVGVALGLLQSTQLSIILLIVANIMIIVLIFSIMRVNGTLQRNEVERIKALSSTADTQPEAGSMADTVARFAKVYGLTSREADVAELLLAGRSVPYIAEKLVLSSSTVHTHVKHIYEKTGVSNRQELMDLGEKTRSGDSV